MTTATKTVAELYRTNAAVRDLIDYWVQFRRCPIGLVDELLIEGMEDAADCATWCVRQPDRKVYEMVAEKHGERDGYCGTYPSCNCVDEPEWVWCAMFQQNFTNAFDVPADNIPVNTGYHTADSPALAIIWLLDTWRRSS